MGLAHFNSSEFFTNWDCKYYPCHESDEALNCLFCFCPLYNQDCPAQEEHLKGTGIKDCSKCTFPHERLNYKKVIERLK